MRNAFTPDQLAWIEALESGEYKQAECALHSGGKFCCLGVALHLKDPQHSSLEAGLSWLPKKFVTVYELRGNSGELSEPWRGNCTLASANDEGVTFAEIANLMREKPWIVFTNFDAPQ